MPNGKKLFDTLPYEHLTKLLHRYRRASGNQCWEWLGCKDRDGYGLQEYIIEYDGKKKKKQWRAHRLFFYLFYGELPVDLQVLHSCDNPGCVNPDHLSLGTNQDNMKDCNDRGRRPRGEKHFWFGKRMPLHVGLAVAESNRRRKQPIGPDGRFVKTKKPENKSPAPNNQIKNF